MCPPSQTAIVTGAGRGLGRLVAQALAGTGVAVGLLARSADELAESVHLVEAAGGVAASVVADVREEPAVAAAVDELRRTLGPIDLLVNNAGVPGPVAPAWEVDPSSWWHTIEVNLGGAFWCSRNVLPDMVARRRGRIVNITSQAGVFRWPTASAYAVSKAAVIKATENLAVETHRSGICVFSFDPGLLPIGFSEAALRDDAPDDPHVQRLFAWIRQQLDQGHGADPATAVDRIVRLASGRYDGLSGCHLSVHDDLDAAAARIDAAEGSELYLLRRQEATP